MLDGGRDAAVYIVMRYYLQLSRGLTVKKPAPHLLEQ